jgi:hypothetical protein
MRSPQWQDGEQYQFYCETVGLTEQRTDRLLGAGWEGFFIQVECLGVIVVSEQFGVSSPIDDGFEESLNIFVR